MKAWQHGYELGELRQLADVFRRHDDGLILGAFTGVNESRVAAWLSQRRLVSTGVTSAAGAPGSDASGAPDVVAALRRIAKPTVVKDFRGQGVVTLPVGALLVERLGYDPDPSAEVAALAMLEEFDTAGITCAAWLFNEHPGDMRLAASMGWRRLATKIRASSELLGLWGDERLEPSVLPAHEWLGLARLELPALDVAPLVERLFARELDHLSAWAPHYSGYNERGTWSALGLRGFGGDPTWIDKPAEMSRKWKAEHAERLELACTDTPLRAELPEVEPLIAAIPGPKERVRLMRVEGSGGALSRHADITDPDAGVAEGRLLRIHVPLLTNAQVEFWSWAPDGQVARAHMAPGEAWYLDTRKPHAARNAGLAARIHLVLDTWATPDLLALLPS